VLVDVNFHWLLGLDEEGVRRPAAKKGKQRRKIQLTDDKACWELQDRVAAGVRASDLGQRVDDLEQRAEKVMAARSNWEQYGQPGGDTTLKLELDSWLREMAILLRECEDETLAKDQWSRFQGWTARYVTLSKLYAEVLWLHRAIGQGSIPYACRREELMRVKGAAVNLGVGHTVAPEQVNWARWAAVQGDLNKELYKELQGQKRSELRQQQSERYRKVVKRIEENKWKGLVKQQLRQHWSSGDKDTLMVDTKDKGRRLVSEPEEVKETLRTYFAKWMGQGVELWFRSGVARFVAAGQVGRAAQIKEALETVKVEIQKAEGRQYAKRGWLPGSAEGTGGRKGLVPGRQQGEEEASLEPEDVEEGLEEARQEAQGLQEMWDEISGVSKTHPLFAEGIEGARVRRAFVRGQLSEAEEEILSEQMHPQARGAMQAWKMRQIVDQGVWRPLCEQDHRERGVMRIAREDWEGLVREMGPNKAADSMGIHVNLMKVLLKSVNIEGAKGSRGKNHSRSRRSKKAVAKRRVGQRRGAGEEERERDSPAGFVSELIRRIVAIVLGTGLMPQCMAEEILCTLNKVPGSIDPKDTRPIGLLCLWRNMMMGDQMSKVMEVLERKGALGDWQHGYRRLRGTDGPLMVSRLVAEHCWQYKRPICPPEPPVSMLPVP
jgi:hypothetical protein